MTFGELQSKAAERADLDIFGRGIKKIKKPALGELSEERVG